jgi:hypothetical protein
MGIKTPNTVTIQLTREQAVALHDIVFRLGAMMSIRRQKQGQSGKIPAPDVKENTMHEVVRQLAPVMAALRDDDNTPP